MVYPRIQKNYDPHNHTRISHPRSNFINVCFFFHMQHATLLRRGNYTFILATRYVIQCPLEVFPRVLE